MSSRTGSHGLPAEYRTPDGQTEDWGAAMGYLQALEASGRMVVAAVIDAENSSPTIRVSQQICFVRLVPRAEKNPDLQRIALDWPEPGQSCGELTLDERAFTGTSLSTNDGDDYFGLRLNLGRVAVVFLDTNTNMEHAGEEWRKRYRRGYLDLPTAEEIEKKWDAEPDPNKIAAIKDEIRRIRREFASRGITAAEDMSDAEIQAAGKRVSWNLRMSGRMSDVPHTEWQKLWLEEFADALRRGSQV